MKKLLSVLACLLMVFSLVGCGEKKASPVGKYKYCEYDECEEFVITESTISADGESLNITYDDNNLYVKDGSQQITMHWSKDNAGNLHLNYDGDEIMLEKK